MPTVTPAAKTGRSFASFDAGALESWEEHSFLHPRLGKEIKGKLFLKGLLGLTGMEISLNKLPPRTFVPFSHRHRENEEVYIFVKGRGRFMVDGSVIEVQAGTVIRVSPDGARTWRNDSDEDLYYVVVQARAGTIGEGAVADGVPLEERPRWRKAQGADASDGGSHA